MSLVAYHRKRHFSSTPEPAGKSRRRTERLYVMHKHRARNLHYDLRLELDGVLKSWAVPKGPSLDPRDKRLAIQVEDHPIEYGDFEGDIPEGEYGAGTAIIWDRGTWNPLDDPHDGMRQGKLKFELQAEKLHGAWVLVASPPNRQSRQPQWLLIKVKDDAARSRDEVDVTEQFPNSVASRRTIDERATSQLAKKGKKSATPPAKRDVAHGEKLHERSKVKPGVESSAKPRKASTRAAPSRSKGQRSGAHLKTVSGAKPAKMPQSVDLQLATFVSQPPSGDEWLSEIKLDGYRIACQIAAGNATLYSRQHQDWTARFAAVASAACELPVSQAILDGEVVVFLPDGRTSFQALQNAMSEDHTASLSYVVFDLLYLDGYDLREATLDDRKRILAELLLPQKNPRIQYLEHVVGQADRFFQECCKRELEGIICKRRARRYVSGRGSDWLKAKCLLRQEFVIGGYTDSTNKRRPFGALLLGYYDKPGRLVYAGRVGTGWNERTMMELSTQLELLNQRESPFVSPVNQQGKLHWVRPRLVAEVSFSQWTRDGRLRQPSFGGLREDKPAAKVGREKPEDGVVSADLQTHNGVPRQQSASHRRSSDASRVRQRSSRPAISKAKGERGTKSKSRPKAAQKGLLSEHLEQQLQGVTLTNPDRVLYPELGLTKLDLAAYYAQVGETMLPFVVDRPLSLVRCPQGRAEKCFFQKHQTGNVPASLIGVAVREGSQSQKYFVLKNLAGLLALVQLGVLEIHLWGSQAKNLERPDQIVFDLDPGPDVVWDQVIRAARQLRHLLAEFDLKSFVKTTGGKGLHIVAPIEPRASWPEAKQFCKTIAQHIAAAEPSLYTIHPSKNQRQGRIFLDYLRNDRARRAWPLIRRGLGRERRSPSR